MIKRIVIWSATWLIIVGTVAWATMYLTDGTLPTFVSAKTINYGSITHTLYVLDVKQYLKTLELNVSIPIKQMFYSMPSMYKPNWNNVANVDFIPKLMINLFIWWVNILVWWFNLVLFIPMKLGLQPIIAILSLMGIDLQKYGIISVVYVVYKQTPPIIPYW